MPIVRIDLRKGKDAAYRRKVGHAVYDALTGGRAPKNHRFQIIGEHDAGGFQFDPTYLGVQRTQDLVMVQIIWNEGRATEQKRARYKAIADGLDVLITLVDVQKANGSCGDGAAPYVI